MNRAYAMNSNATGAINAPEILEAMHFESFEAQPLEEEEEEEESLEEAPGSNIEPLQEKKKKKRERENKKH